MITGYHGIEIVEDPTAKVGVIYPLDENGFRIVEGDPRPVCAFKMHRDTIAILVEALATKALEP